MLHIFIFFFFFFNDTATTEIYTLSLHDALPIYSAAQSLSRAALVIAVLGLAGRVPAYGERLWRSEEHTSELQSRRDLVCRLLLEKKNNLKLIILYLGEVINYIVSCVH